MPQHLNLIAITVRDYDEAIAFYTQKLGWDLLEDSDRSHEGGGSKGAKRWVRVGPPGTSGERADGEKTTAVGAGVLLARAKNDRELASVGNQTGGRVFLFIETDDCRRDAAVLKGRGVEFVREPADSDIGVAAVFRDLYGNLFDLVQRK